MARSFLLSSSSSRPLPPRQDYRNPASGSGLGRCAGAAGVLALAALLALGSSCSPKEGVPGAGDGKKKYEIAFIPKGTTHVFWQMIHAGAVKAEREINDEGKLSVQIHWKGPLKEDEAKDQIELVQTFISRGVQGMCLAPNDKSALKKVVQQVTAAGIPVIVFDSGLDAEVGKDFVSYVATDNYKGGVLGAQRLGEVLGGEGKVILLRFMVGSESTMQREKGFLDTIAKDFPNITIIEKDQYAGATETEAFQKSQNLLTRYAATGDTEGVDGIFCPNESAAAGMLEALRSAKLAGKVKLVGFDASEKLVSALRKKELHGLVLQNPIKMAYESVKACVRHLEGGQVEPRIDTGVVMVTPDNFEQDEMKLLHSPDLSQWLGK